MAKSLNVSTATAKQVIPFLQAPGYIEASGNGKWLTTVAGDTVAGSKPPRFSPEAVETALSALAERIKAANQDASARFRITKAVAFGDFLSGARHQAIGGNSVALSLLFRQPPPYAHGCSGYRKRVRPEAGYQTEEMIPEPASRRMGGTCAGLIAKTGNRIRCPNLCVG